MASIFINSGVEYLNIDATVGIDGVNNHDDVCLVKALLYEVLKYHYGSPIYAVKFPPLLNGTFDSQTKDALAEYKQISNEKAAVASGNPSHYSNLVNNKVYYKKHIDPIRGSVFAFGSRVLWTMARLNEQVQMNSINGSFDTVKGFMFRKYPMLKPIFK